MTTRKERKMKGGGNEMEEHECKGEKRNATKKGGDEMEENKREVDEREENDEEGSEMKKTKRRDLMKVCPVCNKIMHW